MNITTNSDFSLKKEIKEELEEETDAALLPRRKRATHILPPHMLKEVKQEVEEEELTVFGQCLADIRRNPELPVEYIMIRRQQSEEAAERYMAVQEIWDRFARFDSEKPAKRRNIEVTAPAELPKKRAKPSKKNWRELEEEEYDSSQLVSAEKRESTRKRRSQEKKKIEKLEDQTTSQPNTEEDVVIQPVQNNEGPSKPVQTNQGTQRTSTQSIVAQQPKKEKKQSKKYSCPICTKAARSGTCLCIGCGEWVHLKCAGIKMSQYDSNFRCRNCSQ